MKDNSKMIFIMAMEDIFTPMEITILEIGKMGRDLDGVDQLTSPAKSMKECGNIVSLWAVEYLSNLKYLQLKFENYCFR